MLMPKTDVNHYQEMLVHPDLELRFFRMGFSKTSLGFVLSIDLFGHYFHKGRRLLIDAIYVLLYYKLYITMVTVLCLSRSAELRLPPTIAQSCPSHQIIQVLELIGL